MPRVSDAEEGRVFSARVVDPRNTVVVIAADAKGEDREIYEEAELIAGDLPFHFAFWILDLALIKDHMTPEWELAPGRFTVVGCADRRVTDKGTNDSLREQDTPSLDLIMALFDRGDAACTGAGQ